MHIRANQASSVNVNPYAAAAERAIAALRTLNGRRKLSKAVASTERLASPEEACLLAKWMEGQASQQPEAFCYRLGSTDNDAKMI